jgi:hypothetical protein
VAAPQLFLLLLLVDSDFFDVLAAALSDFSPLPLPLPFPVEADLLLEDLLA